MTSPLVPVLLTRAGLAAFTGAVGDAALIGSVIALNGLVGGLQRRKTEHQLSQMGMTTEQLYPLRRCGDERILPADQIQAADIVAAFSGIAILLAGLSRNLPVHDVIGSGVSLAVAAVPEGLHIMATMAQLASASRLGKKGVLVRNPRSIEALGRVTVLCADKTGMLTHEPGLQKEMQNWQRARELPFKSERGYHAGLFTRGGSKRLCVKGAPEILLERCNRWQQPDGRVVRMNDSDQARFTQLG